MNELPSNEYLIRSIQARIMKSRAKTECQCSSYQSLEGQKDALESKVQFLGEEIQRLKKSIAGRESQYAGVNRGEKVAQSYGSNILRPHKRQETICKGIQNVERRQKAQLIKMAGEKTQGSEGERIVVPHRKYESGRRVKELIYGRKDRLNATPLVHKSYLNYDHEYRVHEDIYKHASQGSPSRYNHIQSKIRPRVQRDRLRLAVDGSSRK